MKASLLKKKIMIVNNIIEEPLYSFKMFPFHKTKNDYIDPLLENILVVENVDDYKTLSKSSIAWLNLLHQE